MLLLIDRRHRVWHRMAIDLEPVLAAETTEEAVLVPLLQQQYKGWTLISVGLENSQYATRWEKYLKRVDDDLGVFR